MVVASKKGEKETSREKAQMILLSRERQKENTKEGVKDKTRCERQQHVWIPRQEICM